MKVYAALYEKGGKFLIGHKRGLNSWWGKETRLHSHCVGEAGQYCLPGGLQKSNETYMQAGARVFRAKTGHEMLSPRCTHTFVRDGYVVVCFEVVKLRALQEEINAGLGPRPSDSEIPLNGEVEDWELDKVVIAPQIILERYLGVARPFTNFATSAAAVADAEKNQFLRWHKEMALLLKTVR